MIAPEVRTEIRRLFFAEHFKIGTIADVMGVAWDTVRQAIGSAAFSSVASAMQDFVELQRPGERKRRLWAEATSRRAESRSLPILPRLQASRISSGGMHLLE